MINIVDYLDYTVWLRDLLKSGKKINKKYTQTAVAVAVGVQKAYLSKVTKGQANLSSDQIFLLSRYLQLSEKEAQYLTLIHDYSRTGLEKRRAELRTKIEELRLRDQDVRAKLKTEFIDSETSETVAYFLDPYSTIVHMLLTIDHYRQDTEAIARDLLMAPEHLKEILRVMEKLEFIKLNSLTKQYEILKQHFFIHKTSPLSPPHQALVRTHSAAQLLRIQAPQKQSFNLTFTTDEASVAKIRESFVKWLKELESIISDTEAERAYQLNYDLFPWT